jgi:hypothetical protein
MMIHNDNNLKNNGWMMMDDENQGQLMNGFLVVQLGYYWHDYCMYDD